MYKASTQSSDKNGTWESTIKVKAFGNGKTSRTVATAKSGNNGDNFAGDNWHLNFKVNDSTVCSWGKQENKSYNVIKTLSSTGTDIKFTLDRYRDRFWHDDRDVQSIMMEIYPFG